MLPPADLSSAFMPTYEFACPRGHEFEKFYGKISDAAAELPCPECGEVASRRISGGAGLLFKGSGFYLTDYGKNAHRRDAKPAGESGAKGGEGKGGGEPKSGGETKAGGDAAASSKPAAESKPAAKADAPKKSD